MQAASEAFWQIPLWAQQLLYIMAGISVLSFLIGILRQVIKLRRCRGHSGWQWSGLSKKLFVYILGQRKIRSKKPTGTIHFLIFLGFSILFLVTVILSANTYLSDIILNNWRYNVLSFVADLAGIILLIGAGMALYRRVVDTSGENENQQEDVAILLILIAIVLTGFLTEGLRIAASSPPLKELSILGYIFAQIILLFDVAPKTLVDGHLVVWLVHIVLSFGLIAIIPFSKLFHVLTSPANMLVSPHQDQSLAVLEPLQNIENELEIGVVKPSDLGRKDMLEAAACTNCRRCEDQCPAYLTGKPLSPRKILQGIKTSIEIGSNLLSVDGENSNGIISSEAVWNCTSCGSCVEHCPVSNNPLNQIAKMRIGLTSKGYVPAFAARALESIQALENPWDVDIAKRSEWLEKLRLPDISDEQVEVIYWAGCGVSYETRIQEIAVAVTGILSKAGVKFKVLAKEEICCGDPARRIGDEALFQDLARRNQKTLTKYAGKTVLTHCPHCYHVLKNEYAQLGYENNVIHHSQYILDLIRSKRLTLKEQWEQKVIYHDPCYLGRHNKEFYNPRKLIDSIPNLELLEFEDNQNMAMCCGGGGGQLWLESEPGDRINYRRFAQAEQKQPDVIATACPYCMLMLDTASTHSDFNGKIKVRDISELVYFN